MVKVSPNHLLNQQILVISGGIGYDEYGMETYSYIVVSSGLARLQYLDERTITAAGTVLHTTVRAYVDPAVSGSIGQHVEIEDQRFKINGVRKMIDGRGLQRLNVLALEEVAE